MDNIERLKKATQKVNKIVLEKLQELPYFNNTNFNENLKTFKRDLIYGEKLTTDGQLALYSSRLNTLFIDENNLDEIISDELLELLILHEYLHMASTNQEKQIVGFESEAMPVTYNEALTQWLTLKLYYGQENMQEAIRNNIIYPESVKRVDSIIANVGEENVFNRFFEADIKKNISELPRGCRNEWLNQILFLGDSEEEKNAKLSLERLEQNITSISEKQKKSSEQKTNEQESFQL